MIADGNTMTQYENVMIAEGNISHLVIAFRISLKWGIFVGFARFTGFENLLRTRGRSSRMSSLMLEARFSCILSLTVISSICCSGITRLLIAFSSKFSSLTKARHFPLQDVPIVFSVLNSSF